MRILFIGDVFGEPGRDFLTDYLYRVRHEEKVDFCIANGENATHGRGLSRGHAEELLAAGVDFITMGNHTWSHADIFDYIGELPIVRPANFPSSLPGRGFASVPCRGMRLGILNLEGRIFIDPPGDNPFEAAEKALSVLSAESDFILVDFHAEATSEKKALAVFLDGRVGAVLGTHTHVAAADEQILKGGTAFITDVGMTGVCAEGVIGMKSGPVLQKMAGGFPARFEPAAGKAEMNAVLLEVSEETGRAVSIRRIRAEKPSSL